MVGNVNVVVYEELKPSTLPVVQIFLREDVLQAFMIGERVEGHTIQIKSPYA